MINIAYAHATKTHSIQSTQSENFIIYVKFFGEIISFGLSIILYVILRFQLEYSQSLLSPLVILKQINDGARQYGTIIKVPFIVGVGIRCVFLESTQYLSHKASPQKPIQITFKKIPYKIESSDLC